MTSVKGIGEGTPPGEESSLLAGLRVVRERWWVILLCFVVCLGIATALAKTSTKQYTATATLLSQSSNLASLVNPTQAQTIDPARQAADTLTLIQSGTVAARVKSQLHLSESVSDLKGRVDASADPNTDLVNVSITDPSPQRAATLTNAFANSLVSYLTEQEQAQIAAGEAQINSQLAHLGPSDSSARTVLEQALKQVVALRAVTNGNVQVVDPAQVPSSPSSPNVKRDAAVGGVVGLVLGLALAFMLDLFDRRIKSAEQLERLYGLSALASIPLRKRRATTDREIQGELEPFRILRDGLAYISLRKQTRVILVTSAVPGEGKTRVATGLAQAIAAADKSVALVEADVHRPAVKHQFGIQFNGRGLTNALVDGTSPLDLVEADSRLPSLSVLPSGTFTPNSAELLGSPAMANVLAKLASGFEYVILDGPPLLPVADARVLLDDSMVDVALVVARPYLTTRDQVRGALAVLRRHPEKGIGLVVNATRETTAGGYYYPGAATNGAPERRGLGRLIGSSRQERTSA